MPQTDWRGNLVNDYWDDWDPSVNYWEGFQQPEIGGGWNDPMKSGPFNQPLHNLITGGGNAYNELSNLGNFGPNSGQSPGFDPNLSNILNPLGPLFAGLFNENLAPGQTPGFNPEATTPSANPAGNPSQGGNKMPNLQNIMPYILAGLTAASGGISNTEGARTSKSKQSGSSSSTETFRTTPEYDELGTQVRKLLFDQLQDRLKSSPDFVKSYISGSIKSINESSDITKRLMENTITSRGLGRTSAGATPLVNLDLSRIMQALQIKSSGPLIEEDLKSKRLQELTNFFSLQPVGQFGTTERTSTFNQEGEQIGAGSVLGGILSGAGQGLAYPYYLDRLKGITKPPTVPTATPPFNPNAGGYTNPTFQMPPIFKPPKFPTLGGN